MKKHLLWIVMISMSLLLVACGTDKEEKKSNEAVPEELKAALTVPETAEVGQEVEVSAKVTQGDEVVSDADEVVFEVVDESTSEKKMIDSTWNGKDAYVAKVTFEHGGQYAVTSHVTARSLHTMPTKKVNVQGGTENPAGNPPATEQSEGHHHGSDVSITFEGGQGKVNEETKLATTIKMHDEPLQEAKVRFEVFSEGTGETKWVNASEISPGVYEANHTFPTAGSYKVKMHVEKGHDIHDHKEQQYTIQ